MLQGTDEVGAAERLMGAVARGDQAALAQLFEAEAGRLLGVARRIVRRRELAEEVVQDAFVTVWRKAAHFDARRGSVRGWLTAIVRNRALNVVRDGARMEIHDSDSIVRLGDRRQDADAAYASLPERHALKRCLDRLDAPRRRSILLCYVTGLTHGEVAATLGAPLGTVKAWIRRGMAALKDCLG